MSDDTSPRVVKDAFRVGDVIARICRYGEPGDYSCLTSFSPTIDPPEILQDEDAYDGLQLENLADAVNVARAMVGLWEERHTLVDFAELMRGNTVPIESIDE